MIRSRLVLAFAFGFFLSIAATLTSLQAADEGLVALVNGDPISSYDLAQRQRFMNSVNGGEVQKEMQKAVRAPDIQEKFRAFAQQFPPPTSQADVENIKKQFIMSLQKSIQQRLASSSSPSSRKAALEELIDETLKLQAAKKEGITVSDSEVTEAMTRKSDDGKVERNADELIAQLKNMGVDPKTYKDKIRAALAWRRTVQRLFSYRVATAVGNIEDSTDAASASKMLYDVRVVRVNLPANADQKAIQKAWSDANHLKERFSSCATLPEQAKLFSNVALKSISKAALSSFAPEARPMIAKSGADQMTPPVVLKDGVEAYAVCKRYSENSDDKKDKKNEKKDERQQQFELLAASYLKKLRQEAHIEYR